MIQFEFQRVTAGWWAVTAGRSLDDIEYTVHVDGSSYPGRYCRIEQLIQLYECARLSLPTAEHPIKPVYSVEEVNDAVLLEIDEQNVETSWVELEQTTATFLRDLFAALDEQSTESETVAGLAYLDDADELRFDWSDRHVDLFD